VGSDISAVAARSGLAPPSENVLAIRLLGQNYTVTFPSAEIAAENGLKMDIREKILILHYLIRADDTPLTGHWVRFAGLEDGGFYQKAFAARDEGRFLRLCLSAPEAWPSAALRLDGKVGCHGDSSVVVCTLSRVPVLLVFWKGDEEVPPAARILFDASVNHYLSTEDVSVLCDILLSKLGREAPPQSR
jgi:hypothetical protein